MSNFSSLLRGLVVIISTAYSHCKSLPAALVQVKDTMPFPMRGSGSSECSDKVCWTSGTTPAGTVWTNSAKAPSQHTVWTHDRVASRIHGKTPPHQVNFGTNSSCDVTTVASRIADDLAELDDMMPEPATKCKIAGCSQVLQADGSYRWCCPLCPFCSHHHEQRWWAFFGWNCNINWIRIDDGLFIRVEQQLWRILRILLRPGKK